MNVTPLDERAPRISRTACIAIFTLVCVVAALLWPAVPQPLSYHAFVDRRALLDIPNFFDVVSNIGFVVPGAIGIFVVLRRATVFEHPLERLPYLVFFLGMLLTAAGSAYYHLDPDNERLFWDRLPMTIAFMSLLAVLIAERSDVRMSLVLLAPLLLMGAASVVYWRITERAAAGNVIPYGILQGYAIVILLLIAVLLPSRYTRARDIFWVCAWYGVAKLLEALDAQIFALGQLLSGHTLKHLAAGAAGLVICRTLSVRTLESASRVG